MTGQEKQLLVQTLVLVLCSAHAVICACICAVQEQGDSAQQVVLIKDEPLEFYREVYTSATTCVYKVIEWAGTLQVKIATARVTPSVNVEVSLQGSLCCMMPHSFGHSQPG